MDMTIEDYKARVVDPASTPDVIAKAKACLKEYAASLDYVTGGESDPAPWLLAAGHMFARHRADILWTGRTTLQPLANAEG